MSVSMKREEKLRKAAATSGNQGEVPVAILL